MRTTQVIGLNKRAEAFIERNAVNPDGEYTGQALLGMFGEGAYTCRVFEYHDDRILSPDYFEEYLQIDPWSSGPMLFLALRWIDGEPIPESLWLEDISARENQYNREFGTYWV